MRRAWIGYVLGGLVLSACGADADAPSGDDEDEELLGQDPDPCIDRDEDGYGFECAKGPDCDDADDTIFEGCICPFAKEGCGCDPTAEPVMCELPKSAVINGRLCKTGMQYCRDGVWTACEGIAVFQN